MPSQPRSVRGPELLGERGNSILSSCPLPGQGNPRPVCLPPRFFARPVAGQVIVRIRRATRTKTGARCVSMSNVHPLLPQLTVNRQFMSDFLAAKTPCFALGLVEERKRQCGFMALRLDEPLPPEITNPGFRFGPPWRFRSWVAGKALLLPRDPTTALPTTAGHRPRRWPAVSVPKALIFRRPSVAGLARPLIRGQHFCKQGMVTHCIHKNLRVY